MATQGNVYSNLGNDRGEPGLEPLSGEASPAKLHQMVETGKARLHEWTVGLEDGVRHKPIQSILIAAGVGAVIGLLLGRGSR